MTVNVKKLYAQGTPETMPFRINKIGHVVLRVSDLEASTQFYTEVLGFKVSDVYPDDMMPGGMVFMRFNTDHHGVALVGAREGKLENKELHHMAFEVSTLDEVFRARDHLKKHNAKIDFEGRRRAGVQIAVEFRDPDGHCLEIYWGLDQVGTDGKVRPPNEWQWHHTLEEAVASPPPGQNPSLQDPSLLKK